MNIELEKNSIRNDISNYYQHLQMTKVKEINGYSLYYAKIGCMLCIEDQYIIVTVPNDRYNIGDKVPLERLKWDSFQTRTIYKPPIKLESQEHRKNSSDFIKNPIFVIDKLEDRYIYASQDYPLKIELLSSKKDDLNYNDKGTIETALSTYNCVISFSF